MKKKLIIASSVISLFIVITVCYKTVATNDIRNKTYDFLETKGYTQEDITQIEISHSFVNKLLSYNEWRIFVEFKSDPDIIFAFTYRNKEIIKQGVTSDGLLDKDEIRAYDKKFNNGELKSQ